MDTDPVDAELMTVDRVLGEHAIRLQVPMYAKDRRKIWADIDRLLDLRLGLARSGGGNNQDEPGV